MRYHKATQKLTLNLPEEIFHHLARIAELTHQTIESLSVQSIKSNLPPTVENAPLEMQASLQAMQTLSVDELFKIAHSQVPAVQQQRHLALLERNQETESMSQRQELRKLGQAADQLMLKKAYAWAILRWRGYRIPALDELPLE
jgi:cell division protein ZapA (FtsZ GTPase activity inhibitor)